VQAGVEVKLVPGPDGDETFVLARSADRRKKEKAIHDRFIARMAAGLTKLQASIESGRLDGHRPGARAAVAAAGAALAPAPEPFAGKKCSTWAQRRVFFAS